MEQSYIILLIILALGLLLNIDSLSIAGCVLILLKLLNLKFTFPKLETYGLKIGIIILTIGFLTPIAAGKYNIEDIIESIRSPLGISAIIGGLLVIMFTNKGYNIMKANPSIIIPVVFGSIIGMIVFKGIPVGPLVASGITSIIYSLYKLVIEKFTLF